MTSGYTVIGAGPAGLTAALALARGGAKVQVFERRAAAAGAESFGGREFSFCSAACRLRFLQAPERYIRSL